MISFALHTFSTHATTPHKEVHTVRTIVALQDAPHLPMPFLKRGPEMKAFPSTPLHSAAF